MHVTYQIPLKGFNMCRYMRPDAINEHLRRRARFWVFVQSILCKALPLSGPFRSFQVLSGPFSIFQHFLGAVPAPPDPRTRRFDNSAEMTHSAGEDGHSDAAELWPVDFCRWVYHRNDILRSVGMIHLPNLYLATAFCSVEMIVDNLLEFAVWTTPTELESLANLEMPETWR